MSRKKIVKKTQKSKHHPHLELPDPISIKIGGGVKKKLGQDPTLKPRVVETKSTWTEEEQNENPLNRKVADILNLKDEPTPLPQGFKTADNITEVDDLKFENGRLREMLVSWLDHKVVDGVTYQVMVDPMNREVVIRSEKYAGV